VELQLKALICNFFSVSPHFPVGCVHKKVAAQAIAPARDLLVGVTQSEAILNCAQKKTHECATRQEHE
jgi:hypothetical protein